jgi:hypothetical protein
MNTNEKYIINGEHVIAVYHVGDNTYTPKTTIFHREPDNVYTNKMDAHYANLIKQLSKGKPLENYKSSKYYDYYIQRLTEDNPEYLI